VAEVREIFGANVLPGGAHAVERRAEKDAAALGWIMHLVAKTGIFERVGDRPTEVADFARIIGAIVGGEIERLPAESIGREWRFHRGERAHAALTGADGFPCLFTG